LHPPHIAHADDTPNHTLVLQMMQVMLRQMRRAMTPQPTDDAIKQSDTAHHSLQMMQRTQMKQNDTTHRTLQMMQRTQMKQNDTAHRTLQMMQRTQMKQIDTTAFR